MRDSMLKKALLVGFCAVTLGLMSTAAEAVVAVRMTIDDSATVGLDFDSGIVAGTAVGCTAATCSGVLGSGFVFQNVVGNASGTSNGPGTTTIAQIDLQGAHISHPTGAGTLTITVTGFDFALPIGLNMDLRDTGSATVALVSNFSDQSQAWADPNNGGALVNPSPTVNLGPAAGSTSLSGDSGLTAWLRTQPLFSLTTRAIITLGNAGEIVSIGQSSQATATAVPEPASLLLLGSGLLVAGRKLRKKTAKA